MQTDHLEGRLRAGEENIAVWPKAKEARRVRLDTSRRSALQDGMLELLWLKAVRALKVVTGSGWDLRQIWGQCARATEGREPVPGPVGRNAVKLEVDSAASRSNVRELEESPVKADFPKKSRMVRPGWSDARQADLCP